MARQTTRTAPKRKERKNIAAGVAHVNSTFNNTKVLIHWGHVGILSAYATALRQITDAAFHEGEHAE